MQAYLLMKTDQPCAELALPQGLLEHARSVWIESCKHIRVSALHRDVARVLTLMGLPHTIEQLTEDSLFSVDIALAGTPHSLIGDGSCNLHCLACAFLRSPSVLNLLRAATSSLWKLCCLFCLVLVSLLDGCRDLLLSTTGEKIAVEVDGPHHFTANGQRPLGEMRARHRLLHVRGWSVLSVPYFVWSAQPDDTAHVVFLHQVHAFQLFLSLPILFLDMPILRFFTRYTPVSFFSGWPNVFWKCQPRLSRSTHPNCMLIKH